jgi:CRP-like cAMP-binding protein
MEKISPKLAKTIDGVRTKHYPKGQIMLYQGDTPQEVYVLKEGVIKIYDIDEQGNEKVLHLLKPYSIAPFASFSGNGATIQWFYSALTDCKVCVVPIEDFNKQMKADNDLALYLMNWFSSEVHELLVRLSSLGKTNARDKVVAALKFLSTLHATQRRSGWSRVAFPVSHQLIADLTGVTRESAATIMRELSSEEIVRNPRQTILEINLDKLHKEPKPPNIS